MHSEDLTRTGMHGRLMVNLGWKYMPGLPDISRLVNGGCPCLAAANAGEKPLPCTSSYHHQLIQFSVNTGAGTSHVALSSFSSKQAPAMCSAAVCDDFSSKEMIQSGAEKRQWQPHRHCVQGSATQQTQVFGSCVLRLLSLGAGRFCFRQLGRLARTLDRA